MLDSLTPEFFNMPLVQYYIAVMLTFIPLARCYERAGFKVWFVLLLAIPYFGAIIVPGILACRRWPAQTNAEVKS